MLRFSSVLFYTLLLLPAFPACGETLSEIETLANSYAEKRDPSLAESLAEKIETNPTEVVNKFIPRLHDRNVTEYQLAVYVWALGLSKSQRAVNELTNLYEESSSELVKNSCLRALAAIGGEKVGVFLIKVLDTSTDEKLRLNLLSLLGQMQYEQALPKIEEILKRDPRKYYWLSFIVFGKMGDKAIPLLISKVNDKERNVRFNAINVLGNCLIAPEAAKPIEAQFWVEDDKELRELELSSLERTVTDLRQLKSIFEQVIAVEKDDNLIKFARESLDLVNQPRISSSLKKKSVSAVTFQTEYAKLYKSAGQKGNYEILANSSSIGDEQKLKILRERILQRESDESIYDVQKVNYVIILNRIANQ